MKNPLNKNVLVFLVVLFFCCLPDAMQAQIKGKSIPELRQAEQNKALLTAVKPLPKRPALLDLRTAILDQQQRTAPKAYSYDELGFFCKMEVKLEQSTKFPIKIRLGEVQYVEKMEGKYD